ncbi:cupin domain-containing protein [Variovorax boronicumulans]
MNPTAFSNKAQEAGLVLTGEVEIAVGNLTKALCPGEGYYFDSQMPHRFRDVGKTKTENCQRVALPPTDQALFDARTPRTILQTGTQIDLPDVSAGNE